MRLLAGGLLAVLISGPTQAGTAALAVTLAASPVARSCAVASTATIVAYDRTATTRIAYRFVRSDGSVTPVAHLVLAGEGAVARSVRDRWTPRGNAPWVALEIVAPEPVRSPHVAIVPPCAHGVLADR